MGAYRFDPSITTLMDQMYPEWQEHADAMMALLHERIPVVYPKKVLCEQLPLIYEELYLTVTNTTPNKPAHIEARKEFA